MSGNRQVNMANLVIIESPGKVSTIKHCLGSNYKVVASVGHVRDLPKSTLGIDVDDHFKAHYINIRGKGELIRELKKEAKNADVVYLATDPGGRAKPSPGTWPTLWRSRRKRPAA